MNKSSNKFAHIKLLTKCESIIVHVAKFIIDTSGGMFLSNVINDHRNIYKFIMIIMQFLEKKLYFRHQFFPYRV